MAEVDKAAFGMGCFWGPEALFGAQEGVIRTRVGYAGGEKEDPTYRSLGDHTETVVVEYDTEEISYLDLLDIFWDNHDPRRKRKPQYQSKIFYTSDQQKALATEALEKRPDARTELETLEPFYVAEDYHQKYRLRNSRLMKEFQEMTTEGFRDSPLAAKANGYAAGHLTEEEYNRFREELG